jgi:Phage Tail Collar Domain
MFWRYRPRGAIGDQRVELVLVEHAAAREGVRDLLDGGPVPLDQRFRFLPHLVILGRRFRGSIVRKEIVMTRKMKLGCAVVILGMGAAVMPARALDYIGEIIFMGAVFCPVGTIPTDGQLLPIEQNKALFSLMGTTYGGDGQTTFATQAPNAPVRACMVVNGSYPSRR